MNKQDIKDITYFLSLEYNDYGYTEVLERGIRNLAITITRENIKSDKELMEILGIIFLSTVTLNDYKRR